MHKARIVVNGIYAFGVICVLALVSYSIYCSYAFWEGLWHGPYTNLLTPFIFNRSVAITLGVGSIPMALACASFYRFNGIAKSKYAFLKGLIIWLPACVCFLSLLVLFHEMVVGWAFRNF